MSWKPEDDSSEDEDSGVDIGQDLVFSRRRLVGAIVMYHMYMTLSVLVSPFSANTQEMEASAPHTDFVSKSGVQFSTDRAAVCWTIVAAARASAVGTNMYCFMRLCFLFVSIV